MSEFDSGFNKYCGDVLDYLETVDMGSYNQHRETWNASRESIKKDGPVFRVKKLEWVGNNNKCISGKYFIRKNKEANYIIGFPDSNTKASQTIEEAKAACQAHYEAEMMKNLVEVEL